MFVNRPAEQTLHIGEAPLDRPSAHFPNEQVHAWAENREIDDSFPKRSAAISPKWRHHSRFTVSAESLTPRRMAARAIKLATPDSFSSQNPRVSSLKVTYRGFAAAWADSQSYSRLV